MTAEQPAQPKKPRRLPRIRYSLRTLLLFTLLAGSVMGLWFRWEPWERKKRFNSKPANKIMDATAGQIVTRSYVDDGERYWDISTGKEVKTAAGSRLFCNGFEPTVWPDRQRAWKERIERFLSKSALKEQDPLQNMVPLSYISDGKPGAFYFNQNIILVAEDGHELGKLNTGDESILCAAFSPDNARILSGNGNNQRFNIWDVQSGVNLCRFSERYPVQAVLFLTEDMIATQDLLHNIQIWHRRRPEYWWGVAWLWEFWLTLVFGCGLAWSVWRDRRELPGATG
jgi:hypothetical protein